MNGKIHVASIENLARLEAILGEFAEKTSETLDSFGRNVERRLEGLEEYCEQLERDAEYWDDQYETADDEEDDIGYLAYKRDEAQEKLQRARRTQRRVEESAENFARAARRVHAISSERLAEARAFLEHKIQELNEYTSFQLADSNLPSGIAQLFGANAANVKLHSINEAGSTFSGEFKSVWNLSHFDRGRNIEQFILGRAANIPVCNFDVIDDFDDGVATSIKSFDLKAKTYQRKVPLIGLLNRYAKKLSNFKGLEKGNFKVEEKDIKKRVLAVAFQQDAATKEQKQALDGFLESAHAKYTNIEIIYRFMD